MFICFLLDHCGRNFGLVVTKTSVLCIGKPQLRRSQHLPEVVVQEGSAIASLKFLELELFYSWVITEFESPHYFNDLIRKTFSNV